MEKQSLVVNFLADAVSCDLNNNYKMSSYLRQSQYASNLHCLQNGVDDKFYTENNLAFLINKTTINIEQNIKVTNNVQLETIPYPINRAIFIRDNFFKNDTTGKILATVVTEWLLVDTTSRKILRKMPENINFPFCKNERENSVKEKQIKTEPQNKVGEYTVRFCSIDDNHHLNNSFYADIVCDYLPIEIMSKKAIKKFVITYRKEMLLGETMEVYCDKLDDMYIVQGVKDGTVMFDSNVYFE